jgi:hypothetical protein
LASCQKDTNSTDLPSFDNSFYPLTVGSWISYKVVDIRIDSEINLNDTSEYQLKELIESVEEQNNDYINYRLERYIRTNEKDDWQIRDVWLIRQYARRIHKIEENIEYYKLINPVKLDEKWDGNAFNTSDEQIYEISALTDTLFHNISLKKSTVLQIDQSSLIDKTLAQEDYIENIGLAYKIDIDVELNIDPNAEWQDKITKGTLYFQSYLESNHSILE